MRRFWIIFFSVLSMFLTSAVLFQDAVVASTDATCTLQPAKLEAWWRFEGNGDDQIGGQDGDLKGDARYKTGYVGSALTVEDGGYLKTTDNSELHPDEGDFSLLAWIRVTERNPDNIDMIVEMKSTKTLGIFGGDSKYSLFLDQGYLAAEIKDSKKRGGVYRLSQSPIKADGTWHFVGLTFNRDDPTGITLYLNGVAQGTFSSKSVKSKITPNKPLQIGAGRDDDEYFTGQIDEVDFYKRALSQSEVEAVYAAGRAGKCLDGPELPVPTKTTVPTATPIPTDIPTPSNTPIPSSTPIPTATPTITPTPTQTPPATATPTQTPVPTAFPTQTAVPTRTPVPLEPTPTPPTLGAYRDVGNVRIWATGFAEQQDGTIVATGNLVLGNAATNQPFFRAAGTATWSETPNSAITFDGTLAVYRNGRQLGLGFFSINTATGSVTWGPTARVLYTTLGTSQLAITPTLTINVREPSVVAQAQLFLDLPEQQSIDTLIQFKIDQTGVSALGTTNLQLKLAGGTLTGTFSVSNDGLRASNVQYSLPGLTTITLVELVIDGRGPVKLHIGATSEFALPNLDLGNGVFVLSDLQATLGLTYTNLTGSGELKYYLGLRGKLNLNQLPQNGSLSVDTFNLYLRDGVIGGEVHHIRLTVAGLKLHIPTASFAHSFSRGDAVQASRYTLIADWATWEVPTAWRSTFKTTVSLRNVVLTTEAPFLEIGGVGAGISRDEAFYLGGTGESNAHIRFDQLGVRFVYNLDSHTWNAELQARILFKFGNDSVFVDNVVLRIDNGLVSASIDNVTLKLAGLELRVDQLAYANNAFTAQQVTLILPLSWGNQSVALSNLRITKDGLTFDDVTGRFSLPDIVLGDVLTLRNNSAVIVVDQFRNYSIDITTSITIDKVFSLTNNPTVSVAGTLTIANGRVSGVVSGFTFKLVGFEFQVSNATFRDNVITVEQASLQLPANLGGAYASVTGLEIGGEHGFRVQGGSFRLPDFTIAGIGIQNVQAELTRFDDGTYGVAAQAKFNFTGFSIEGRFRVAYNPNNGNVALRHVYVAFESTTVRTGIPVGPDFYLTRVWGEFNVDANTLNLALGVKAASGAVVLGEPLVGVEGSVYIQIRPSFEFRTHAKAKLLGLNITSVDLRITRTAFHLQAELNAGIIHASLELAFGLDAANEFTFYGRATVDIIIERGSLVSFLFIKIPPWDMNLGRLQLDAGKFRHKDQNVWGARLLGRVLGIKYYVFVKFSPGFGIKVGTRWSAYQPVLPAVRPSYDFLEADDLVYEVTVTAPTTELTFIEGVTTTHRTDPGSLVVLGPPGVVFTQTLEYEEADHSQRVYSVQVAQPDQALGTWTLVSKQDNVVLAFGVTPEPTVSTFNACLDTTCLDTLAEGATAAPLLLQQGQSLDLDWATDHVTNGLSVQVYAQHASVMRSLIAESHTDAGQSLSGNARWPTQPVANGVYTLTLHVEDQLHGITTVRKVPVQIVDDQPPAAPQNLHAVARSDGSVGVFWDASAAEPDVAGYHVSVDQQAPLVAEVPAGTRLGTYDLYGLNSGATYTISLAAYDINDHVGAVATTTVTLAAAGVNATWPTRGMQATLIDDISITFNQPILYGTFTLEQANGTRIPGSIEPITFATQPTRISTIGLRFLPAGGMLEPGSYVARVRAFFPGTAEPLDVEWPFEVVEPTIRIYLPLVQAVQR